MLQRPPLRPRLSLPTTTRSNPALAAMMAVNLLALAARAFETIALAPHAFPERDANLKLDALLALFNVAAEENSMFFTCLICEASGIV